MSLYPPSKIPYVTQLISTKRLASKIRLVGSSIDRFYGPLVSHNNPLIVICILKGSILFFSDLIRSLHIPLHTHFIGISSYSGDTSTGHLNLYLNTLTVQTIDITNKHILLIEDIIDTSLTINFLINHFNSFNPSSINVASLLLKPCSSFVPKFCCFNIPNHFVVGYGLDYNEQYRNIPYVGILHQ